MNVIFDSPYLLIVLFGALIFFSVLLLLSIRILNKMLSYFNRIEQEIKRILNQS